MKLLLMIMLMFPLLGLAKETLVTNAPVVKVKSNENKMEKLFKQIDGTSSKIKSFSAKFEQIDKDPMFDEIENSSGEFKLLVKEDKEVSSPTYLIRFDYQKPEKSLTIINQSKIILYSEGMIKPQTSVIGDPIKMQALFAGFMSTKKMTDNYNLSVEKDSSESVTLKLMPKTQLAKDSFLSLIISFSKKNWLPTEIIQNKINGQIIKIIFTAPQLNPTIKPEIFTLENINQHIKSQRKKT